MSPHQDSMPRPGMFEIARGQQNNGMLRLSEGDILLYLWGDAPVEISPGDTIVGVLDDLTKVSLIHCIVIAQRHVGKQDTVRYRYHVKPRCVILGSQQFTHDDRMVENLSFSLHDTALFNDHEALGTSYFNSADLIQRIARSDDQVKDVSVGDMNWIRYYTGKRYIFHSDTILGKITAAHVSRASTGISVELAPATGVFVGIRPDEPMTIVEALRRMERVLQFFDVIMGRSQGVAEIKVYSGRDPHATSSDVRVSMWPAHRRSRREEASPLDALIDPAREPDTFGSVLSKWLTRDVKWSGARSRLTRAWSRSSYDYDRIVAAANVFDLLPSDEYPSSEPISANLQQALENAKGAFSRLPVSEARNSVLGSLGRVGSLNLKKKVRHRLKRITDTIELPGIDVVLDEAVNYRNYYVHGTPPRVGSSKISGFLKFLTDTLEFAFVASDLVDAGWDLRSWCAKRRPRGHPLHDYLVDYRRNSGRLMAELNRVTAGL
ncbi:MAG: hypothetical protein OXC31_11500 [Spirochaetaceae bacterium]|nr:hypothetical protein [Spirochaetaceae bacterium]